MNAALLVVVGVILLYFTITGKFDCLFAAFSECRRRQFAETAPTAQPSTIDSRMPANTADILKTVFA